MQRDEAAGGAGCASSPPLLSLPLSINLLSASPRAGLSTGLSDVGPDATFPT